MNQSGRPLTFPGPDPDAAGQRHALIIGCGTFADDNISALPLAARDAGDLYRLLTTENSALYPETNVVMLVDAKATRTAILDAIRSVCRRTATNDVLIVYFSGHGSLDSLNPQSVRQDAYLIAHDTELGKVYDRGISMRDFVSELLKSPAHEVVVILDTCYSASAAPGIAIDGMTSRGMMSDLAASRPREMDTDFTREFTSVRGRHLVTSSGFLEPAYELENLRNGFFTSFLLRGLSGEGDRNNDGAVELSELFDAISENMRGYVQPQLGKIQQTPFLFSVRTGVSPVLTATYASGSTAADRHVANEAVYLQRRMGLLGTPDQDLARALVAFSKSNPDHPFCATARQGIDAWLIQMLHGKLAGLRQNPFDRDAFMEWKRDALQVCAQFEKRLQTPLGRREVQRLARDISEAEPHVDQLVAEEVPEGFFRMGSDSGGDMDERPARAIWLDAFTIDTFEVSNAEFAGFMAGGGYVTRSLWSDEGWTWLQANRIEAPAYWSDPVFGQHRPDGPVVGVSWHEAQAYARYCGNARLPTEAEWERAAAGDGEQSLYPWGDDPPLDVQQGRFVARANFAQSGLVAVGGPAGRAQFPGDISQVGCRHMAGNVAEWVQDTYEPLFYTYVSGVASNPVCIIPRPFKVLRGGAWSRDAGYLSRQHREGAAAEMRFKHVGFRLVRGSTHRATVTGGQTAEGSQ